MQNNYPVLKQRHPKELAQRTQWHFATALIVPYYQLRFVIVHHV